LFFFFISHELMPASSTTRIDAVEPGYRQSKAVNRASHCNAASKEGP